MFKAEIDPLYSKTWKETETSRAPNTEPRSVKAILEELKALNPRYQEVAEQVVKAFTIKSQDSGVGSGPVIGRLTDQLSQEMQAHSVNRNEGMSKGQALRLLEAGSELLDNPQALTLLTELGNSLHARHNVATEKSQSPTKAAPWLTEERIKGVLAGIFNTLKSYL